MAVFPGRMITAFFTLLFALVLEVWGRRVGILFTLEFGVNLGNIFYPYLKGNPCIYSCLKMDFYCVSFSGKQIGGGDEGIEFFWKKFRMYMVLHRIDM